jgi:gluconate kinase
MFVQLQVELPLLQERVAKRPGHFMPASLLTSQLETLEPLEADEAGLTVSTQEGIEATADAVVSQLRAPAAVAS